MIPVPFPFSKRSDNDVYCKHEGKEAKYERVKVNVMARTRQIAEPEIVPMLKTVEQMSRLSGIGESKLRELIERGEIEYVQNGNKKLLADNAIWSWYDRNKTTACMGGVC
jgi:excisionase family DNA binding protein